MEALRITEAPHGGAAWRELVNLRHEVLRAPLGLEFSSEELAAEAPHVHIGAYREELPVGTVMLVLLSAERAQIRQMAVRPDWRGRGVGRQLLRYLEAWAAHAGVRELVAEARIEALGFYENLGYTAAGEEYIKLGVPHRDIVKNLKPHA